MSSISRKKLYDDLNLDSISLHMDRELILKEIENTRRSTEEEAKTEALYERVRSVLNKLDSPEFNTLVDQVRKLNIDTPGRLQGVADLIFEKAVAEPRFSAPCASMCKKLGMMQVSGVDKNSKECISLKKLIINQCQNEFERNPINEMAIAKKLREIEDIGDPEKKKDLQLALEEEEHRIRIKSVGNIRFINELYKQKILTVKIIYRCIKELLIRSDEHSLECLCILLTTVGKDLALKTSSPKAIQDCFGIIQDIVSRQNHLEISSRICSMLQDIINLKPDNKSVNRSKYSKTPFPKYSKPNFKK